MTSPFYHATSLLLITHTLPPSSYTNSQTQTHARVHTHAHTHTRTHTRAHTHTHTHTHTRTHTHTHTHNTHSHTSAGPAREQHCDHRTGVHSCNHRRAFVSFKRNRRAQAGDASRGCGGGDGGAYLCVCVKVCWETGRGASCGCGGGDAGAYLCVCV